MSTDLGEDHPAIEAQGEDAAQLADDLKKVYLKNGCSARNCFRSTVNF
jgi:hypothetical protein